MKKKYRIQQFILLIACLNINAVFAQQLKTKDSIIYLKEVVIENNSKAKEVNLRIKGNGKETRGFQKQNSRFVSLVRNIPNGQLSSITFYFNTGQVPETTKYELGLLIFELGKDGKPGKQLSDKDVRFKLKSGKKGKTVLNLRSLNLNSQENLFFGIQVLDDLSKMPLLIDFFKSENAISFYTENEEKIWRTPKGIPVQLKFTK